MKSMTNGIATRIKKSYSISRESEQFIRRIRKARKIASDSEALDQILRESRDAQSRHALDAAFKNYYDEASTEQLAEELQWASFATDGFASLSK